MNIDAVLRRAAIDQLDAEVLLAFVLRRDRAWLFSHSDGELSHTQEDEFAQYVSRRIAHEPVAYITGVKEFYGREFFVDRRVLIPRPSTEGLAQLLIEFLGSGKELTREVDSDIVAQSRKFADLADVRTVVDVGTGSGCIAVTVALERPDLRIIATDISGDALAVARKNIARYGINERVELRKGSLLDPVQDIRVPFVVVSNPPYVPEGQKLPDDVALYEPHEALFGSGVLEALISQCENCRFCAGFCIERQK